MLTLTEANSKLIPDQTTVTSEIVESTVLKTGEAGYDPFSRRWTQSRNYYVSKPGGDAQTAAVVGPGGGNMAKGIVPIVAALEAAAADARKLVDTSAPMDEGTESNILHDFELPTSSNGKSALADILDSSEVSKFVGSSTPPHSWDDNAKLDDNRQKKDDRRDFDRDHKRNRYSRDGVSSRNADRRYYNDRRHEDYKRCEKYADEDQKSFHKLSPRSRGGTGSHGSYSDHARREFEQNRSRDNVDKHSRERSDGSGHRSRDKDREASSLEYQKKYKDSSSDRGGSGRRQTNFKGEEVRSGEGDKHKRDDVRDDKRDHPRTSKDGKSECFEEPMGHRSGHHHKDTSWRETKELDDPKYARVEKGKSYDQEPRSNQFG